MSKKLTGALLLSFSAFIPAEMTSHAQQVAIGETIEGGCIVNAPVDGAWDVWYELVVVKNIGYFPPHVHDGIECVTTTKGVGQWWVAQGGGETNAVPAKESFLVPDLTVHTGGNADQSEMDYLSTHIMRAGAPFRDVCTALNAPASTNATVDSSTPFNVVFRNQRGVDRPFKVKQNMTSLPPGASVTVHGDNGPAYVAAVDGALSLKSGDETKTLRPGEGMAIPAGASETIGNAGQGAARLAVLEVAAL